MKRQITCTLATVIAGLLVAFAAAAAGAEAPTVSTAQYYDDLQTQQDAYFQMVSFRSVVLPATVAYDELMAQQEAFIERGASSDDLNLAAGYAR